MTKPKRRSTATADNEEHSSVLQSRRVPAGEYGFPLTIYLLSGWLGSSFPALVPTHAGGHVLNDLIGWQGDPHLSPFHLASYLVMGAGFIVLAKAWPVLWKAQREHHLAATGPYGRVRHPQ